MSRTQVTQSSQKTLFVENIWDNVVCLQESNDIKDAAEPSVNATETVNEKCENDEKKSNGNHTPV